MQFDRQTLSIAMRFLMAKTPEQRAAVDLDTHYTQVRFHSFIPYHMMMMLISSIIQSYIQFEPHPMYLCRNILNNILELKQEDRYYIRDMWKGYQLLGCSQIMGLMARSTPAAFLLVYPLWKENENKWDEVFSVIFVYY